MMLNFPNNPQINDEYSANNASWVWDGVVWRVKPVDNVVTLQQVTSVFNTPATDSTLGTIRVGNGLSITVDGTLSANAFQAVTGFTGLQFLSFISGVSINEFSSDDTLAGNANNAVPTERAVKTYVDTQLSLIDLDANGTVSSATAQELAFYQANGNTVIGTGNTLRWNSVSETLTANNITVANTLTTTGLTLNGSGQVSGDLLISGDVSANSIFNEGLGIAKFEFGADLIFDALGDINVSGSKITNLGAPTASTDAVNKAYVDGAAAQFTGGDVPNAVRILSNTASSSTTTGALRVVGGVGVGGDIYAGGSIFVNGSPVLTSLSGGFNGGTISGTLFINNITASSSTTTGALRVTGGVGVGRSIFTGGDSYFNGIRFGNGADIGSGFAQNIAIGGGSGINSPLSSNVAGVNDIAIGFSSLGQLTGGSDNISIGVEAMANRLSGERNVGIGTGVLKDNQGNNNIGIGHEAGILILTGNGNVVLGNNSGSSIDGLNNHVIISDGAGNIKVLFDSAGAIGLAGTNYGTAGQILTSNGPGSAATWSPPTSFSGGTVANDSNFASTTASTSTTSGAVVIGGGLGVGGAVFAGSLQNTPIGSSTRNTGAFTSLTSNGATTFTAGTASSSISTGTLVVTGGVGISGAVFTGSTINIGGVASFTANTASSSTATGSIVVTGGIGVSGRVTADNFNGVAVPAAAVAPGANAFVRTDASGYAYTNYINANNGVEAITAPGNFIVTNAGGDQNFLRKTSTASVRTALNVNTTSSLQLGSLGIGTAASGTAGEIRATNNITAFFSSDRKFKENIRDIPNALDKVIGIGGKLFDWTDEYLTTHGGADEYFLPKEDFGVVAQDVEQHFAVATRRRPDGSLAVDYEKMCALAFAAIVELKKQIDELKGLK